MCVLKIGQSYCVLRAPSERAISVANILLN